MADANPPKTKPPPAPPVGIILGMYILLGAVLSFVFGRQPGTVADLAELVPSIVVVCIFLVSYELLDVMGCGQAKARAGIFKKDYKDWPTRVPEEVWLAERAQSNQLEQMPVFLVSISLFSLLVNATVGAVLGLIWVVIRRVYAERYRKSVGKKFADKGLGQLTIPCYFIIATMLTGAAVHALRWKIQHDF